MINLLRRRIKRFFREFLIYHNSSLEYRAKIFTLVVAANNKIEECEIDLLRECACDIYKNDEERCEILIEMIKEYHEKIMHKNGLDFEHLVFQVERETRDVKRFSQKINLEMLLRFQTCAMSDEDRLYQARVIEFLEDLKQRYA